MFVMFVWKECKHQAVLFGTEINTNLNSWSCPLDCLVSQGLLDKGEKLLSVLDDTISVGIIKIVSIKCTHSVNSVLPKRVLVEALIHQPVQSEHHVMHIYRPQKCNAFAKGNFSKQEKLLRTLWAIMSGSSETNWGEADWLEDSEPPTGSDCATQHWRRPHQPQESEGGQAESAHGIIASRQGWGHGHVTASFIVATNFSKWCESHATPEHRKELILFLILVDTFTELTFFVLDLECEWTTSKLAHWVLNVRASRAASLRQGISMQSPVLEASLPTHFSAKAKCSQSAKLVCDQLFHLVNSTRLQCPNLPTIWLCTECHHAGLTGPWLIHGRCASQRIGLVATSHIIH